MAKHILIISTSLRKDSNSGALADAFAKGAQAAGHSVEQVSLSGKTIQFCKGCLACQKTRSCVLADDAGAIVEQMLRADVIAFATPIYFYEMAGQMKTLLDRSNPAYASQYRFRDIYLLATAADPDPAAVDGAAQGLAGWIACFAETRLAGVVRGVGADAPGAVKALAGALEEAYEMGKAVS